MKEPVSPVQLSPRWSATMAMRRSVLSHGLCGPVYGRHPEAGRSKRNADYLEVIMQ